MKMKVFMDLNEDIFKRIAYGMCQKSKEDHKIKTKKLVAS